MTRPSLTSARRTGGFTLLEMVISLVVFILLAGAIFGIVTGVMKSASTLQVNQDRRDQIAALDGFLTTKFGSLTAANALMSYHRGDGGGSTPDGIVLNMNGRLMAFDAKNQDNGLYTLRVAFATSTDTSILQGQTGTLMANFISAVKEDKKTLAWTPLIRDVKNFNWRFQDLMSGLWMDHWDNPAGKPNLVEFSMFLSGEIQPVTMDFWLPHLTFSQMAIPQPKSVHAH